MILIDHILQHSIINLFKDQMYYVYLSSLNFSCDDWSMRYKLIMNDNMIQLYTVEKNITFLFKEDILGDK